MYQILSNNQINMIKNMIKWTCETMLYPLFASNFQELLTYLKVLLFAIFKILRDLIFENHCSIFKLRLIRKLSTVVTLSVCNIAPHLLALCFNISASEKLSEAAAQRCSVKNVLLKILQNSRDCTWERVSFLIKIMNL